MLTVMLTSHPVFHRLLHKVEALPSRVKLMFVRPFEVQQITDNLEEISDEGSDK